MKKIKKKGKAIQIKEKVLTLDEVFSQVAITSSASTTPGLSNIVLTPLSSEACLRHGINPEALKKRDFESFRQDGPVDLDIQRIRYESYERRRHELMQTALEEKAKLEKKNRRQDLSIDNSDNKSLMSSSLNFEQQSKGSSSLLDLEEKRLLKAKEKQKKELLQMLQFEQKAKKIQNDVRMQAERDALLEEKKKAQKRKQIRRAAEERRIREIRRQAQEDAEEEMHRISAIEQFEKQRQIQKEQEAQELENEKLRRFKEAERERKIKLQRVNAERKEEIKRQEIQRAIDERDRKESERQAKVELKRINEQKELERKRDQMARRTSMNKEAARQLEEGRRIALTEKQNKSQRQHDQLTAERESERIKSKREKEMLRQKRAHQARLAKEKEGAVKESLIKKFQEDEDHLSQLKAAKTKDIMLLKEERKIHMELKRENVERIRRMQDYKCLNTMRKVNSNDKRTEELLKEKERQAMQRKKDAMEAKVRKDKLMEVLEKSKTSDGKAIKKMLSRLSLDSDEGLTKTCKKTKRRKAFNIADQNKLKKEITGNTMPPPIIHIGPPPDAPSLLARIAEESEPVKPFISPYLPSR